MLTALRRMRGRALLADEVGLGKTIEAGIILKELLMRGLVRKILILVPASLTLPVAAGDGDQVQRGVHRSPTTPTTGPGDKVIASIDLAKRPEHAKEISAQSYDLLIVDEAHRLRNRTSQAWKFVNSIKRKYMLLLTATPVHNDLSELYSLVTLLKPGLLKTYRAFRQRYVDPSDPLRPRNWAELKALLSEVMIRNRRASVSVKFPPRTAYTYQVKLSKPERELYDAVSGFITVRQALGDRPADPEPACSGKSAAVRRRPRRRWRSLLSRQRSSRKTRGRLPGLGEARRIGPDTRARSMPSARSSRRRQDKVIVFTEFVASQKLIVEGAESTGRVGRRVQWRHDCSGEEPGRGGVQKDAQVLVSTESGGEGRNLQFCNVMMNYDLPWNPMLIEQRIGRIHRLGQTREVFVFNLAAETRSRPTSWTCWRTRSGCSSLSSANST